MPSSRSGALASRVGSIVLTSSGAGNAGLFMKSAASAVPQQGQGPVGLPGREEVPGGAPDLPGGLEPFAGAQLERLLPGRVPGSQLGPQHLAHELVIAEAGPLIVQRDQEQIGRVDAAQERRRVRPPGHDRACVRGQLAQDGGVEHEPGNLRGLLIKDLGHEVLGDRVAADPQRPRRLRRVPGAAQRQRRHLQRRGPPLAALVQQLQVSRGDLHAEVRQ